jgi:hypothetical protein
MGSNTASASSVILMSLTLPPSGHCGQVGTLIASIKPLRIPEWEKTRHWPGKGRSPQLPGLAGHFPALAVECKTSPFPIGRRSRPVPGVSMRSQLANLTFSGNRGKLTSAGPQRPSTTAPTFLPHVAGRFFALTCLAQTIGLSACRRQQTDLRTGAACREPVSRADGPLSSQRPSETPAHRDAPR